MSEKKPIRGVLVSLTSERGGLRLNLHDAVRDGHDPGLWRRAELITFQDMDEKEFVNVEFDEKELADFAYYVLARIHAFKTLGEAP